MRLDDVADRMAWVRYRETTGGLDIELDGGPYFAVTADPVRLLDGWGVKVRVIASSKRRQTMLTSANGPMEFLGAVEGDGRGARLADRRSEESSVELDVNPVEFVRIWPGDSGAPPLTEGQALALEVSLWGVSGESSRDPVRRPHLFDVRVTVGRGKARAVVERPKRFKKP